MLRKLWAKGAESLAKRISRQILDNLSSDQFANNSVIYNLFNKDRPRRARGGEIADNRYQMINLGSANDKVWVAASVQPNEYEVGLMQGARWGTDDIVWLITQLMPTSGLLIDVGANIGCVTIPVAIKNHAVVAVEMLPENYMKLYAGLIANDLRNVEVVPLAASSSNSIIKYGGQDAWGAVGHGDLTTVALKIDDIASTSPMINVFGPSSAVVMKVDVEGHELDVLRGAREMLEHLKPFIIFESIHTNNKDALECKLLLCEIGYQLYYQSGRVLSPRTPHDFQESLVSDFLAVPPQRLQTLDGLEVRPLTNEERRKVILRDAGGTEAHREHASLVMKLFENTTLVD